MDDAPIRIFLLCDADECAFNKSLEEARGKLTIKELEVEYINWYNTFGNTIENSQKGLNNEFPEVMDKLTQFIGCQNGITAYVDRDRMYFLPFNLI